MPEGELLASFLLEVFATTQVGAHLPFAPATLGLTARQAAAVPAPRFNSIWAITLHVTYWQEAPLRLLLGQGDPEGSSWMPPGDPADDAAWLAARTRAIAINAQLADHISRLDTAGLEAMVAAWGQSVRRVVLGTMAHNSYHIAEILTVRHMQGWWLADT